MDILPGIESSNHSPGVREICCRGSLNNAFVPASENIKRLAQWDIISSVVRRIVEHEGTELSRARHKSQTGPDFKAEDCTDKTLITGTDGVMVPLVTQEQKLKRRKTQAAKRKKEKHKSTINVISGVVIRINGRTNRHHPHCFTVGTISLLS